MRTAYLRITSEFRDSLATHSLSYDHLTVISAGCTFIFDFFPTSLVRPAKHSEISHAAQPIRYKRLPTPALGEAASVDMCVCSRWLRDLLL